MTIALFPEKLATGKFEKLAGNKKYTVAAVLCVIAAVIMGIVYFSNGGFPELNLLFV